MHRLLTIVPIFLLLSSLLGGTASAAVISGVVEAPSEFADYEVWLVNELDLSAPEQPLTRASVDSDSGAWSLSWEGEGPFWIVLRQRFVPHFGPPIDLFLPVDLLPFDELPARTTTLSGIDPELLMKRQKLSTEPALFGRWLGIVLIVLLGGLVTRWVLRRHAAPPGDASAPLRASAFRSRPGRSERKTIFGILGVAALLRFQGMFSESLDLLEVSYLPGIGRPSPFGGGATGLQAIPHMLREMAELYCLDLVHPPLYHLMLGVMRLLGPADWLLVPRSTTYAHTFERYGRGVRKAIRETDYMRIIDECLLRDALAEDGFTEGIGRCSVHSVTIA